MSWQAASPWPIFILLFSVPLLAVAQDEENLSPENPDRQPSKSAPSFLDGVVTAKKKYSFTVSSDGRSHTVRLLPSTIVAARIIRPELDWQAGVVRGIIPASAPDGRGANHLTVEFPLPKPVYFRHQFESAEAMQKQLDSPTIHLKEPILSRNRLPDANTAGETPEWTGELQPGRKPNQFQANIDGEPRLIEASWSTLVLEGFTLLDLKPLESDVFINGEVRDGEFLAARIEFARRVNLREIFELAQSKCLLIGDTVSFNYLPALITELQDEVHVHHPNANCLGSASHRNLDRWLGPHEPEYRWDVIAFNFGHDDSELDQETYQANLRKCVQRLLSRTDHLIWIESTPVPYGFNDPDLQEGEFIPQDQQFDLQFEELSPRGLKPGRMKLQNRWAAEVMSEFPEVSTCKLWEVVKQDDGGEFNKWWFGKSLNFKYTETLPLAKTLADHIRRGLKKPSAPQ